mmetsp:Transcript_6962/g.17291  ORF Transcript_6962/g.17291 Transcript_6962/m.17291 type:complete len:272 (-) Transcript_6962:287-1102(-)
MRSALMNTLNSHTATQRRGPPPPGPLASAARPPRSDQPPVPAPAACSVVPPVQRQQHAEPRTPLVARARVGPARLLLEALRLYVGRHTAPAERTHGCRHPRTLRHKRLLCSVLLRSVLLIGCKAGARCAPPALALPPALLRGYFAQVEGAHDGAVREARPFWGRCSPSGMLVVSLRSASVGSPRRSPTRRAPSTSAARARAPRARAPRPTRGTRRRNSVRVGESSREEEEERASATGKVSPEGMRDLSCGRAARKNSRPQRPRARPISRSI